MQFQMDLQHRRWYPSSGDVVDVSGDSLSILVRAHPSRSRGDGERSSARQGTSVLSARYMYTRMYECARYQAVLHVRITRNDRPGRFPLTLGAPAFLRRSPSSKRPPNYMGYTEDGEKAGDFLLLEKKNSQADVSYIAFISNNQFPYIYL